MLRGLGIAQLFPVRRPAVRSNLKLNQQVQRPFALALRAKNRHAQHLQIYSVSNHLRKQALLAQHYSRNSLRVTMRAILCAQPYALQLNNALRAK